jgi:flagellar basal body-associated protein FliL
MRALILIQIVAIVAILIAVGTGFLSVNQTREAKAPEVSATHNGVTASGGQAPAFDVQTGSVKVGVTSLLSMIQLCAVQH